MQLFRVGRELRLRFQNHVILVQLRVHRVDLALAEVVVKRVVDGRWSDPQPRGRDSVDGQRDRARAGLLIGCHILQLRQLFQLCDKAIGPQIQLIHIGIFQRVLILRAAHPSSTVMFCTGCM